jgi:hypothetical protein
VIVGKSESFQISKGHREYDLIHKTTTMGVCDFGKITKFFIC